MTTTAVTNSEKPLTSKQERFCQEYVVDLNRTQAGIRAGYSAKTAGSIGAELLRTPKVFARVEELQKQIATRTETTQDWVIEQAKLVVLRPGSRDSDRLKSLMLISKILGFVKPDVHLHTPMSDVIDPTDTTSIEAARRVAFFLHEAGKKITASDASTAGPAN